MKQNKHGFTIIELIIVMLVLAILAAIAVPRLTVVVREAQVKADIASIKILNDVTAAYCASLDTPPDDVFSGFDTDQKRMQKLIDVQLMTEIPQPQQKGAAFEWNISSQTWVLNVED